MKTKITTKNSKNILGVATKNILGVATFALSTSGFSQSFFNGCPGPKLTQIDIHANYDVNKKTLDDVYILKAFPEIAKNKKVVVALPMKISKKELSLQGINLGYMQQNIANKNMYGTLALGIFKDATGQLKNILPQAYITAIKNKFTLDAEGSINLTTKQKTGAITLGYGNNRIRAGGSVIFADKEKPTYQGRIRIDLKKNHQFWIEGYLSKQRAGTRIVANF